MPQRRIFRTSFLTTIASLAAMVSLATPAAGQARPDSVQRLDRQLREFDREFRITTPSHQAFGERVYFDYGGAVRYAFISVDEPDGESRFLRQSDAILYARAIVDQAHEFYGRLRFLYNDFNDGDSFDGDGDKLQIPISDRWWYKFDLAKAQLRSNGETGQLGLTFKGGRHFVNWGSGLSLSQALYAGVIDVEYSGIGFVGLLGTTPSSTTIDFDGSRPDFDNDTDRDYAGGILEWRRNSNHTPYFSVLVQRDHNSDGVALITTPTTTYPTMFDYDSEYYAIGSRGSIGSQWLYNAEVVYERGHGLSTSIDPVLGIPASQTREDIEAWAGLLNLTYLVRDPHDSRIEFETIIGSGDADRIDAANTFGGNASGTKDRAFNSLGYANTGLVLFPDPTNLVSVRLGAKTSRTRNGLPWLNCGVDGFLFFKLHSDRALNVFTEDHTFVGGEIDFTVDWRITSDVAAQLRYGIFLPGDAIPSVVDDPRHFLYLGMTYAF